MSRRSLFRSPEDESPYFMGLTANSRRSRKPVRAFRSFGGSNPPLSVCFCFRMPRSAPGWSCQSVIGDADGIEDAWRGVRFR